MIKRIASFFMLVLVFILPGITTSVASQISSQDKSKEVNLVSLNTTPIDPIKEKEIRSKLGVLQIPFIKNESQIKDSSVKFYANTIAGTVFVTDNGITYSLKGKNTDGEDTKVWIIRESLLNTQRIQAEGITASETKVSYFKGNNGTNWKSNIPTYQEVSLGEIYDSIKLNLKAYSKNIEKIFVVEKGGNPENIAVNLEGARGLMVNGNGELEIDTEMGTLKMTAPIAYQQINGKKINVAANYCVINSKLSNPPFVYGFKIGDYDRNYPLVIDPLLASTYIGGNDDDAANSIALDSSGNVFVAGYTYSYTNDIFVAKLNSDLTGLIKVIFIGGSDYESVSALALDSSGNVFITGYTYSNDYPTTSGAYDITCGMNGNCYYDPFGSGSYGDVFVSKLNNTLTTLLASTFIGGSDNEVASALALDSSDNVFITGSTYSNDYPTTQGVWDDTCGTNGNCYYDPFGFGYGDVFVSKLNNTLTSLLASTFIGGSDDESASALALDSSGNVFITGYTYSDGYLPNSYPYPTTPGAYKETYRDIFVSKLDNTLTNLLASTFIGSESGGDSVSSIALDSLKNIFITGYTMSSDYPTTIGAYDRKCGTDGYCDGFYGDVFVSKLNNTLTKLLASTFIGGSDDESASALALDSSGNVFITGYTYSCNYPTKKHMTTHVEWMGIVMVFTVMSLSQS